MKTLHITIIALLSVTLLSSGLVYADPEIIAQLEAKIQELTDKLQNKNAKIDELRDKLKVKTNDIEKLENRLDRKNAKNAELEDALDNKDAKIKHLKEKVDRKIDNKNQKLDAMKTQMGEMQSSEDDLLYDYVECMNFFRGGGIRAASDTTMFSSGGILCKGIDEGPSTIQVYPSWIDRHNSANRKIIENVTIVLISDEKIIDTAIIPKDSHHQHPGYSINLPEGWFVKYDLYVLAGTNEIINATGNHLNGITANGDEFSCKGSISRTDGHVFGRVLSNPNCIGNDRPIVQYAYLELEPRLKTPFEVKTGASYADDYR